MQSPLRIHARLSSPPVRGTRPQPGQLCIISSKAHFPARQWPDFPIVLLGSWTINIFEMLSTGQKSATLPFMEGPYELILTRARGTMKLRAVERLVRGTRTSWSLETNLPDLIAAMSRAYADLARDATRRRYPRKVVRELQLQRDTLLCVSQYLHFAAQLSADRQ